MNGRSTNSLFLSWVPMALLGALVLIVGSCDRSEPVPGGDEARSAGLTPVSFRLNWNPNAEHAPYFLGKKKGFYADEGIDIEILPGQGSATAVKLVGAGDSMFGVAVADAVTVGRAQGVPVVSTAVLLQRSPTVLASFKEKGITQPSDLLGRRVGVSTQSTVYAYWVAFTKINGLDRSEIEEVNVTSSGLGVFLAEQVDASGLLLTNEVVTVEERGRELNIIYYWDYGVKSYGQVIFTRDALIATDPDLARRFTDATLRSWSYAAEHVDEAIDALAEAVPETDRELETAKWEPIQRLVQDPENPVELGHQSLEGWTATYQTFKLGGLIEEDFDPNELFVDVHALGS